MRIEDETTNTESGFEEEMFRLETENRIRNLVWTVSGDYGLKVQPDVDLYMKSRSRGLYDAICEGAFFRYYDRNEFSLYLMKKLYFEADPYALARVTKLCMDAAIFPAISRKRLGIAGIRKQAADDFLESEFASRSREPLGRLEIFYQTGILENEVVVDPETKSLLEDLSELGRTEPDEGGLLSPMAVIALADRLYNRLADPKFEEKFGDLSRVLGLTLEELAEADFDWKEFLREEAMTEMKEVPEGTSAAMEEKQEKRKERRNGQTVELDASDREKTYAYMELNFGRSYMKELEQKRMNYAICRGIHSECSLYFTTGILDNLVRKNYQSEYVRQQKAYNITTYKRHFHAAQRNIQLLADTMRQALIRRTEIDKVRSDTGQIRPRELWKPGRTGDNRLFEKERRENGSDFVVDILMDASGSQRERRGEVAVQGYIISEALSIVGIPHRVQSFCTCWDYTILQMFRSYDDDRSKNDKIFEFSTTANNRDGLAVKAVTHTLLQRPEENRILIVLSDGRPNDRVVNRATSRTPALYVGDVAVDDTAAQVRWARNHGVAVLGVFAGEEEDLAAEKRIFGRDFAYIRQITNFSHVVGRYLRLQIDTI